MGLNLKENGFNCQKIQDVKTFVDERKKLIKFPLKLNNEKQKNKKKNQSLVVSTPRNENSILKHRNCISVSQIQLPAFFSCKPFILIRFVIRAVVAVAVVVLLLLFEKMPRE